MDNSILGIENLVELMNFLKGENTNFCDLNCAIYYAKNENILIIDADKIKKYRKAPELTSYRFIEDIKLLEAISGNYIPIIDKKNKEILFTKEEFDMYRNKMSGLKEYNTGDYIFSNNLYFSELDYYLNQIDDNIEKVNKYKQPIISEIKRLIESVGLTVSLGCNSGGDVELVEAGSTSRYTNIPSDSDDKKRDFDFTVRINPENTWIVKEILETKLQAEGHITKTSNFKVRLTEVTIPGLNKKVDLDFSLTPQKKKYLSTEESLSKRLDNMKEQDEQKYRLVIANIMFAKDMLKKSGSYKPSRSILNGDRSFGGLGGVGIENWILQYGGSFIDASMDFLAHAREKNFIEFEKEYAIMDFGQDHVSTSKGEFPYHNFVMKNMRYRGFEIMRDTLENFIKHINQNNTKKK